MIKICLDVITAYFQVWGVLLRKVPGIFKAMLLWLAFFIPIFTVLEGSLFGSVVLISHLFVASQSESWNAIVLFLVIVLSIILLIVAACITGEATEQMNDRLTKYAHDQRLAQHRQHINQARELSMIENTTYQEPW